LQVRIGIHTGTVVIGDVGGGANREQLALGDTPNIASRIESLAQPNELVISEATLRLLHDSFDFDSRGVTSLRSVATPISLYAVRRERDTRRRFSTLRQGNVVALAGCECELQKLYDGWEIAKQGNHSKYFIRAEAGIGKSRLVQEIRDRVRDDGGIR
jgi:hypothetical protein